MTVGTVRLARLAAVVAVTSLGLLSLGACGDGGDNATTSGGSGSGGLEGRTFLAQQITENGAPKAPAAASVVALSFANATLQVNAGCNTMSGAYRLDEDGTLLLDGLSTTEMACDEALMAQDAWLAALLQAGPVLLLDEDTLTVRGPQTEIVLLDRVVADPSPTLEATTWTLDAIVDGDVASSVPAGMTATIRIEGGQLSLAGACNGGGAAVRVDGDVLQVEPVMMTQMACAEVERMQLDSAIATVLQANPRFRIEGHNLHLDAGDEGTLVFRG